MMSLSNHFLTTRIIHIVAFAIHAPLPITKRGKPHAMRIHKSQHVTKLAAARIGSHSHKRTLAGRLLNDVEKLGAMEEIAATKVGQCSATRINGHTYRIHVGKISKKRNDKKAFTLRFLITL